MVDTDCTFNGSPVPSVPARPAPCWRRGAGLAVAAVAACFLAISPGDSFAFHPLPWEEEEYVDAGNNLFLGDEITFIDVTLPEADLDAMLADPWSNTLRSCTVQISNSEISETHANVGIRPRGNTARNAIKKSWKLDFNAFVAGRKVHGVEKLNINGQHNDPSIIRHKLASDAMNRFHIPSARAAHVRLKINDGTKVEGLFIQLEHIDEQMIEAWFDNTSGSLYKCVRQGAAAPDLMYIPPGTPDVYRTLGGGQVYEEKFQVNPTYVDLAAFIDFVSNATDATFEAEIRARFHVDSYLRALAADAVTGNWDSFWFGQNNYYLYNDPATGRFEFIPYDMDNSYGVDFGSIDWSERPHDPFGQDDKGPFTRRILDVPEFEAQYRRYILELIEPGGIAPLAVLEPEIDLLKAISEPYAYTGSYASEMDFNYDHQKWNTSYTWPGSYRDWGSGWDYGLKPFLEDREDFLLATVPAPSPLPALRLNELVAVNGVGAVDEAGDADDWLEIYNDGPVTVQLGGMVLTDRPAVHDMWTFPAGTTLAPGGFLQVWCDAEPAEGPLHTSFRLDAEGEAVVLYSSASDGSVVIDAAFYELGAEGVSVARLPDGSGDWQFTSMPTPGAENVDGGNIAPVLDDVTHLPLSPSHNESVVVAVDAVDVDGSTTSVTVHYSSGAGFASAPMFDDGAHDDGTSGDGRFGGSIPGFPSATTIAYYVRATDNGGDSRTLPADAPSTAFTYVVEYVPPLLYVNELLALNVSTNQDDAGEFDDWVEIYNGGSTTIDLAGYTLSDDFDEPVEYVIPAVQEAVLAPGAHLLVWLDGDPLQGPLHADFRLSVSGERIGLFAPAIFGNAPIDTLTFGPQQADISFGRETDGAGVWRTFEEPTPSLPNSGAIGLPDAQPTPGASALRLELAPIHPSPLRSATSATLGFTSDRAQRATLKLYDVRGRAVRQLLDRPVSAGAHRVEWDGRNDAGGAVPTGVYFMELRAGDRRSVRKLTIVR